MTKNKMTKKEMWTKVLSFAEVQNNPEIVKAIEHEIELLNKKNSGTKLTKNQIENQSIAPAIVEALETPMTATEVMTAIQPKFADIPLTNQRVTGVLSKLVKAGEVERFAKGRKAFFKRVEG